MSSIIHSFNVEEAETYGIEKAVILYNLRFWLAKNIANSRHNIDGYVWTYNSASAFSKLFPYMKERRISRNLKELEESGAILAANYNARKYDRTKWYSMPEYSTKPLLPNRCQNKQMSDSNICQNEHMQLPVMTNAITSYDRPIPDINTDNKPDINTPPNPQGGKQVQVKVNKSDAFKSVFATYPSHRKGGTDAQAWKAWKSEKLNDLDAGLALAWLTQAASTDPSNWTTTANGFAYGITKFIRERMWLTPVPTAKAGSAAMGWDDISWADNLEEVL